MRSEEIIQDLFEAARSETSVRDISQVQEFIETVKMTGTQSSLIVKWLKQYKMNILLTSTTIIITATIALFPKTQEFPEQLELPPVAQVQPEVVAPEPKTSARAEESQEAMVQNTPAKETVAKTEKTISKQIKEQKPLEKPQAVPQDTSNDKTAVLKSTPTKSIVSATRTAPVDPPAIDKEEKQSKVKTYEHKIVLESKGGKVSAERFEAYLKDNLSKLNPELKTSGSSDFIRKFTLKLDNGLRANFDMQVTGFRTLELNWKTTNKGEVSGLWFRLDEGEISELDLSKESKSSIKVKLTSTDF